MAGSFQYFYFAFADASDGPERERGIITSVSDGEW